MKPARRQVEEAIEQLIGLLDELDGDPDLEDCGDLEPSLCGMAVKLRSGQVVVDGENDTADQEYSLGWGFHVGSHGAANMVNMGDHEGDGAAVS